MYVYTYTYVCKYKHMYVNINIYIEMTKKIEQNVTNYWILGVLGNNGVTFCNLVTM